MKVGTDGVLLGAWTDLKGVKSVIDVGTGTGLLALMLAQRSEILEVDAIEIEKEAAIQAGENVRGSKFSERIQVRQADFNTFSKERQCCYDLMICNPPYFSKARKPDSSGRSLARHDDSLSLSQLFEGAAGLLGKNGRVSIIIPFESVEESNKKAKSAGFYPLTMLHVIPLPGKPPVRSCITYSRKHVTTETGSMIIESGGRHIYSDEYKALTSAFYLDF